MRAKVPWDLGGGVRVLLRGDSEPPDRLRDHQEEKEITSKGEKEPKKSCETTFFVLETFKPCGCISKTKIYIDSN